MLQLKKSPIFGNELKAHKIFSRTDDWGQVIIDNMVGLCDLYICLIRCAFVFLLVLMLFAKRERDCYIIGPSYGEAARCRT